MNWTKDNIRQKLREIKQKGFIAIPQSNFRKDDGIVGQLLEREFGISENNLHLADLGTFELKALRFKKNKPNMLTLFHQTSSAGMTPVEIFERFGYIRKSKRSDVMKKKLFTTIRGDKVNSLGFVLRANGEEEIQLFNQDEYLATWDLSKAKLKIDKVILVFADNKGVTSSVEEEFHYTRALLLDNIKCLAEAIASGAVVMDLCIDQPADKSKGVHDRGPHIRIPVKKLDKLFGNIEELL